MRYWWVNHKQTHREEIDGGYIWSPKKNANGANNNSYNNMPKTSVGDIVFSFAFAEIRAIGEVVDSCASASKPSEFGSKGDNWNNEGWLVKVKWKMIDIPFRAKDHIAQIRPLLASKYAPIQQNGNGNQSCYLASITDELALLLYSLAGQKNKTKIDVDAEEILRDKQENTIVQQIEQDISLMQTEKEQLIKSRRGQGKYRRNLELLESKCRVTGLDDKRFLVASHSKPWRNSNNLEKLDGYNGFLFSPHIDRLYDRGWISFSDNGELLIIEPHIRNILKAWGVPYPFNIGSFTYQQKIYLAYHREFVFKSTLPQN
ncbi:hypothetical protein L2755_04665 [Shewanella abyssi]|uniref:HNH endonuclease n=1 Tax=Shewanella abyssi TaxID=311789 RepID=UPI00200C2B22|nr:HNH endonuclease [Shewanella abyssi]MCL1048922.1 hypothetical protein [Shewanella abyssi]